MGEVDEADAVESAGHTFAAGRYVTIDVRDAGEGMPTDVCARARAVLHSQRTIAAALRAALDVAAAPRGVPNLRRADATHACSTHAFVVCELAAHAVPSENAAVTLSAQLGFELTRRLSGEATLHGALRTVLDATVDIPTVDGGGVYLYDAARARLELVAHRGLSAAFVASVASYSADDPHVAVPKGGEPIFVWHEALASAHEEVRTEGVTALAVVPILHDGTLVAVLNAASRSVPRFDEATQTALLTLAALVGDAIARVAAEEALRASEARLQIALHATGQEPWEMDVEGVSIALGPVWSAALPPAAPRTGDRSRDVRALFARLVHPDDLDAVMERFVASAKGGQFVDSEHRVVRADGSIRWVRVIGRATETGPDGRPRTMAGTTTDVTAERALRAQALQGDRLAALGRLAAGIAHEINNPLAYVLANLDFVTEHLAALEAPGLDDVRNALGEARTGATAVRAIAADLRALARPVADVDVVADVGEAVRKAANLARNEVRHRARLDVEIGALPPVDGAGARIAQVILNLLINAAHALPEGTLEGANVVSVRARTDDVGRACVEVSDTGTGIAPEVLPRIFDPFFTTKAAAQGTGLGLSICHAIVMSLGGTIDVETRLGEGSCFRVTLPPARVRTRPPKPPSAPAPAPAGPLRVLVVDDEAFIAVAARRLLRGHHVEVAIGGEAAIARLEESAAWDVILCDLMMPGVDGPALHALLRERWPALAPRMVVVTGGAFTDRARDFLDREAPPVLSKPFDASSLRAIVAEVGGR